jgi:thiol peroxidase
MNPAQGATERPGGTTFKGTPLTLLGPELKAGDRAPDFQAVDKTMQPVTLENTAGSARIFSVVPSLDTPVCDMQTKRLDNEAAKLSGIHVYTISMDLPFAQSRWCGSFGVDNVTMLSDHKSGSFGNAYGVLIKEWRILSRAVFVIDKEGIIRHAEYVKEVADHPDYEAALSAARTLA